MPSFQAGQVHTQRCRRARAQLRCQPRRHAPQAPGAAAWTCFAGRTAGAPQQACSAHGRLLRAAAMQAQDQPGHAAPGLAGACIGGFMVVGAVGNGAATAPRRQPTDACSSASSMQAVCMSQQAASGRAARSVEARDSRHQEALPRHPAPVECAGYMVCNKSTPMEVGMSFLASAFSCEHVEAAGTCNTCVGTCAPMYRGWGCASERGRVWYVPCISHPRLCRGAALCRAIYGRFSGSGHAGISAGPDASMVPHELKQSAPPAGVGAPAARRQPEWPGSAWRALEQSMLNSIEQWHGLLAASCAWPDRGGHM